MSWLVREGQVLASVADGGHSRRRGSVLEGALVLRAPAVLHTFGSSGSAGGVDVAFCSRCFLDGSEKALVVRRISRMGRRRLARPMVLTGVVVVAPSGAFERWGLNVGDRLEVRGD